MPDELDRTSHIQLNGVALASNCHRSAERVNNSKNKLIQIVSLGIVSGAGLVITTA